MRGIRKRLPSPAMVVALIALFSSLGGVSYGLAKGAINGREVKNRSLSGKDLRSRLGRREGDQGVGPRPRAERLVRLPGRRRHALRRGLGRGRAARAPRRAQHLQEGEDGDYQVVFDKRDPQLRLHGDDRERGLGRPAPSAARSASAWRPRTTGRSWCRRPTRRARRPSVRSTWPSSAEPRPLALARALDLLERAGGGSGGDRERLEVLGHHAVGADHAALARRSRRW